MAVEQAHFKAYNLEKYFVLSFCCVDYKTSTKTNLEVKIDLLGHFGETCFQVPEMNEALCIVCIRELKFD